MVWYLSLVSLSLVYLPGISVRRRQALRLCYIRGPGDLKSYRTQNCCHCVCMLLMIQTCGHAKGKAYLCYLKERVECHY